jgi:hypothetical protein
MEAHEIEAAQASWGQGVVEVGACRTWEEAHEKATALVLSHYQVQDDHLLFCPTKASEQEFRRTLAGAVSYFVGGNPQFGEDQGFALKPWSSVRFSNAGIVCRGEVGLAMGNYFFGHLDGSEFKAEFSFVYIRDDKGNLKIQLHHSSLPYQR